MGWMERELKRTGLRRTEIVASLERGVIKMRDAFSKENAYLAVASML